MNTKGYTKTNYYPQLLNQKEKCGKQTNLLKTDILNMGSPKYNAIKKGKSNQG